MHLPDLKGQTILMAVSGGLDSCTISSPARPPPENCPASSSTVPPTPIRMPLRIACKTPSPAARHCSLSQSPFRTPVPAELVSADQAVSGLRITLHVSPRTYHDVNVRY